MNGIGRVCKFTGISIGVLGTIGSFIVANNTLIKEWSFKMFLYCEISVFLGALLFIAVSEILEKVTVSAYNIRKISEAFENNQNSQQSDDELKKNGWNCPKCGNRNYSYTGTCSCGQSKYELK